MWKFSGDKKKRKKSSVSPTQRTLAHLKSKGYECHVVEKFVMKPGAPGGGFRKDLMNIIDILIVTDTETIGVQSTGGDFSGHQKKMLKEKQAESKKWLACPTRKLFLYSWKKKDPDKRGGWEVRIREFKPEDFESYNLSFR